MFWNCKYQYNAIIRGNPIASDGTIILYDSPVAYMRFPNGQVPSIEAIFEFQPSELTKIILILFFAKFFDLMYRQINKWTKIDTL